MEKESVEVKLHYGALGKPLEEQLNEQGLTLGEKRENIEKLQDALTRCMFHLLTDAQYNSALKKFHKKVMESISLL